MELKPRAYLDTLQNASLLEPFTVFVRQKKIIDRFPYNLPQLILCMCMGGGGWYTPRLGFFRHLLQCNSLFLPPIIFG